MGATGRVVDRGMVVAQAAKAAQRLLLAAGSGPAVISALRSAAGVEPRAVRNPLLPAAVRVERTRAGGRRGEWSEQTALTLWFGEGPGLPSAAAGARGRVVAGTALAMAGAAVLGAATYFANQRPAARITQPGNGQPRLEG